MSQSAEGQMHKSTKVYLYKSTLTLQTWGVNACHTRPFSLKILSEN